MRLTIAIVLLGFVRAFGQQDPEEVSPADETLQGVSPIDPVALALWEPYIVDRIYRLRRCRAEGKELESPKIGFFLRYFRAVTFAKVAGVGFAFTRAVMSDDLVPPEIQKPLVGAYGVALVFSGVDALGAEARRKVLYEKTAREARALRGFLDATPEPLQAIVNPPLVSDDLLLTEETRRYVEARSWDLAGDLNRGVQNMAVMLQMIRCEDESKKSVVRRVREIARRLKSVEPERGKNPAMLRPRIELEND